LSMDASQFGKVPYQIINSGLVGSMKGSDAKVYLVLVGHCSGKNWTACPSLARIAELSGLSRQGVCRSIRHLKKIRAIQVKIGGGRGHANCYILSPNSHTEETVYIECKKAPSTIENSQLCFTDPVKETVNNGTPKQSSQISKTVTSKALNSGALVTRTEYNRKEQTEQKGAAAEIEGKERDRSHNTLAALHHHGIEAPTDQQLINEFPGIRAWMVNEAVSGLNGTAGPGKRINKIREKMPEILDWYEQTCIELTGILETLEAEYEANQQKIDAIISNANLENIRQYIYQSLLKLIGNTRPGQYAVQDWMNNAGKLINNGACRIIVYQGINRAQALKKTTQNTLQLHKPYNQKDDEICHIQDKQAQSDKKWFDGLSDDEVICYFKQMLERPSTGKGFRDRYQDDIPPIKEIRRRWWKPIVDLFAPNHEPLTLTQG